MSTTLQKVTELSHLFETYDSHVSSLDPLSQVSPGEVETMNRISPVCLGSLPMETQFATSFATLDEFSTRTRIQAPSQVALATKRVMDVVGSFLGLLFLAPVMVAVAVLIRFNSRGPILFRQIRLGKEGREFYCLKFRTMVQDAESKLVDLENLNESQGGVLFKIKADPRVTKLGRLLRKSSLDELPQLWNVLVGQMSLVGPRPLQLRDCEKLAAFDAVSFQRRLSVLPGITGPWQVGGRSDTDSQKMLDLDLSYVDDWSVGLDLRILAQTIVVVAVGKGAC